MTYTIIVIIIIVIVIIITNCFQTNSNLQPTATSTRPNYALAFATIQGDLLSSNLLKVVHVFIKSRLSLQSKQEPNCPAAWCQQKNQP